MKFNKISENIQAELVQMLNSAENKSEAIVEACQKIAENMNADLIEQVVAEAKRAEQDAAFEASLGLRSLSENEKKFYENFKDIKQAVTMTQISTIPTEIIDRTTADIVEASDILKLVDFAPANVKRWITGTHSGNAVWGDIYSVATLTGELTAAISSVDIEQNMLHAFLVIPKAVADLALPFVDKYFRAVLAEAMEAGLVKGYIYGNGTNQPIGIKYKLTKAAKTKLTTITELSPLGLAAARQTLTNGGKRKTGTLYLICNPMDEAQYVDPAMLVQNANGAYVNGTGLALEKIVDINVTQGDAFLTIGGAYTMGIKDVTVNQYKETLAMQHADLIMADAYANGRPDDDNTAVYFDVTKLTPAYLKVKQLADA